jgi:hypothetical protein
MGYTVARPAGCNDWEFQDYLLRLRGIKYGCAPRVRDPLTNQGWLYYWEEREGAEQHAERMRRWHKDPSWRVVEVSGPHSLGPLGPVVFSFADGGTTVYLGLSSISESLIASAFPDARPLLFEVRIRRETFEHLRADPGGWAELLRQVGPLMTGLTFDQLNSLGCAVVNERSQQVLLPSRKALLTSA